MRINSDERTSNRSPSTTRKLSSSSKRSSSSSRRSSSSSKTSSSTAKKSLSAAKKLSPIAKKLSSTARKLPLIAKKLSSTARKFPQTAFKSSSAARKLCSSSRKSSSSSSGSSSSVSKASSPAKKLPPTSRKSSLTTGNLPPTARKSSSTSSKISSSSSGSSSSSSGSSSTARKSASTVKKSSSISRKSSSRSSRLSSSSSGSSSNKSSATTRKSSSTARKSRSTSSERSPSFEPFFDVIPSAEELLKETSPEEECGLCYICGALISMPELDDHMASCTSQDDKEKSIDNVNTSAMNGKESSLPSTQLLNDKSTNSSKHAKSNHSSGKPNLPSQSDHPMTPRRPQEDFSCRQCDRTFSSNRGLMLHLNAHKKAGHLETSNTDDKIEKECSSPSTKRVDKKLSDCIKVENVFENSKSSKSPGRKVNSNPVKIRRRARSEHRRSPSRPREEKTKISFYVCGKEFSDEKSMSNHKKVKKAENDCKTPNFVQKVSENSSSPRLRRVSKNLTNSTEFSNGVKISSEPANSCPNLNKPTNNSSSEIPPNHSEDIVSSYNNYAKDNKRTCPKCGQKFLLSKSLKDHLRSQHGEGCNSDDEIEKHYSSPSTKKVEKKLINSIKSSKEIKNSPKISYKKAPSSSNLDNEITKKCLSANIKNQDKNLGNPTKSDKGIKNSPKNSRKKATITPDPGDKLCPTPSAEKADNNLTDSTESVKEAKNSSKNPKPCKSSENNQTQREQRNTKIEISSEPREDCDHPGCNVSNMLQTNLFWHKATVHSVLNGTAKKKDNANPSTSNKNENTSPSNKTENTSASNENENTSSSDEIENTSPGTENETSPSNTTKNTSPSAKSKPPAELKIPPVEYTREHTQSIPMSYSVLLDHDYCSPLVESPAAEVDAIPVEENNLLESKKSATEETTASEDNAAMIEANSSRGVEKVSDERSADQESTQTKSDDQKSSHEKSADRSKPKEDSYNAEKFADLDTSSFRLELSELSMTEGNSFIGGMIQPGNEISGDNKKVEECNNDDKPMFSSSPLKLREPETSREQESSEKVCNSSFKLRIKDDVTFELPIAIRTNTLPQALPCEYKIFAENINKPKTAVPVEDPTVEKSHMARPGNVMNENENTEELPSPDNLLPAPPESPCKSNNKANTLELSESTDENLEVTNNHRKRVRTSSFDGDAMVKENKSQPKRHKSTHYESCSPSSIESQSADIVNEVFSSKEVIVECVEYSESKDNEADIFSEVLGIGEVIVDCVEYSESIDPEQSSLPEANAIDEINKSTGDKQSIQDEKKEEEVNNIEKSESTKESPVDESTATQGTSSAAISKSSQIDEPQESSKFTEENTDVTSKPIQDISATSKRGCKSLKRRAPEETEIRRSQRKRRKIDWKTLTGERDTHSSKKGKQSERVPIQCPHDGCSSTFEDENLLKVHRTVDHFENRDGESMSPERSAEVTTSDNEPSVTPQLESTEEQSADPLETTRNESSQTQEVNGSKSSNKSEDGPIECPRPNCPARFGRPLHLANHLRDHYQQELIARVRAANAEESRQSANKEKTAKENIGNQDPPKTRGNSRKRPPPPSDDDPVADENFPSKRRKVVPKKKKSKKKKGNLSESDNDDDECDHTNCQTELRILRFLLPSYRDHRPQRNLPLEYNSLRKENQPPNELTPGSKRIRKPKKRLSPESDIASEKRILRNRDKNASKKDENHREKPYSAVCSKCCVGFPNAEILAQHNRSQHPEIENQPNPVAPEPAPSVSNCESQQSSILDQDSSDSTVDSPPNSNSDDDDDALTHRCPLTICGQLCGDIEELKFHMEHVHYRRVEELELLLEQLEQKPERQRFSCVLCHEVFDHLTAVLKHLRFCRAGGTGTSTPIVVDQTYEVMQKGMDAKNRKEKRWEEGYVIDHKKKMKVMYIREVNSQGAAAGEADYSKYKPKPMAKYFHKEQWIPDFASEDYEEVSTSIPNANAHYADVPGIRFNKGNNEEGHWDTDEEDRGPPPNKKYIDLKAEQRKRREERREKKKKKKEDEDKGKKGKE